MRNFLFFFIIVVVSCTTSKQDYNPNVTYIVAQTPIYDLYVSKKDIMDYMNMGKNRNRFSHANYDCINQCNKNVTFRISGKEKSYALDFSDIDKYEIADIFEYCAIDLFKQVIGLHQECVNIPPVRCRSVVPTPFVHPLQVRGDAELIEQLVLLIIFEKKIWWLKKMLLHLQCLTKNHPNMPRKERQ